MPEINPNSQQLAVAKREAASFLNSPDIIGQVKRVIVGPIAKYMTADRMLRVVQTAVMKTPRLLEAAAHPMGRLSLLNAIMNCATAGLEPDGRNAHLVPYWNSDVGTYEVQVIFDWKGLVALGLRGGFQSVYPDMVCAEDEFDAWVENGVKKLIHKPHWKSRGQPHLFYCVTMRDGVLDYEIMTFDETESIRKRSRSGDKGPWITDQLEMRKKCPIRRMSKRWELAPEIRQAIFGDDDLPPDIEKPQPEKPATPLFNVGKPEVTVSPELESGNGQDKKEIEALAKSIETKSTKSKMEFSTMAGFLYEMGVIDKKVMVVREIPIDVLRMLDNQWDDMVARVNGGNA